MRTPTPWTLPTQPVTRTLLRASGITDAMIRTQLTLGRVTRLRSGVYLATSAWPESDEAVHVVRAHAEQMANPDAVISHESAAVVWQLPSPTFHAWHESPVSLTLPTGARGSRSRRAAWHIAELPASHVTRDEHGYRVTSLVRTAIDLAAGLPLPEALVILDAAGRRMVESYVGTVRRRDYTAPRFVEAVRSGFTEALPRRWRVGLADAIRKVEPCRESAAESLTAGHLHLSGLPVPEFQARIVTEAGTFYPDCYWRGQRLIGECDGAIKYTSPDAIVLEKEREQVLRDEGNGFVRWLAKEVMLRPAEVMSRIARALAG